MDTSVASVMRKRSLRENSLIYSISELKSTVFRVVQQIIVKPLEQKRDQENKRATVNTTCNSSEAKKHSICVSEKEKVKGDQSKDYMSRVSRIMNRKKENLTE